MMESRVFELHCDRHEHLLCSLIVGRSYGYAGRPRKNTPSIYLSIYLSVSLSIYLSACLLSFIYMSVFLPHLSICRSNLFVWLSVYRSVRLSIYLSIYMSLYLSLCLSKLAFVFLPSAFPRFRLFFFVTSPPPPPPQPCFFLLLFFLKFLSFWPLCICFPGGETTLPNVLPGRVRWSGGGPAGGGGGGGGGGRCPNYPTQKEREPDCELV